MTPGLYIHVPFCGSICSYCNFNRGLLDDALEARYVRAVLREIRAVADRLAAGVHPVTGASVRSSAGASGAGPGPSALDSGLRIADGGRLCADTLYFGGGTPSLLSPDDVGRLVAACRSAFAVADDAEITLEANPETVTRERMEGYRQAGVNRVSMGVQSFRDAELRRLGRVHDAARASQALADTRAAGIENVSLDLMLWLPQQDVASCLYSVQRLCEHRPVHASLYLLELYPNAPLKEEMARAGWSLAPDEDAADMYLGAIDALGRAGYAQYEISNFAQPGFESRHNLKYWTDGEWLAFGCGAHSTMDGVRWKNVAATDAYVARVESGDGLAVADDRRLTRVEQFQEAMFMGLRLVAGVDLGIVEQRYGIDVWRRFGQRLAPFIDAGLLVREAGPGVAGGRIRLTARGLLLSNEVMTVFMDDLGTVK